MNTGIIEIYKETLMAAACKDNKSVIEEHLAYTDDDLQLKSHDIFLARVLHKATEYCSTKVVEVLLNSSHGMLSPNVLYIIAIFKEVIHMLADLYFMLMK